METTNDQTEAPKFSAMSFEASTSIAALAGALAKAQSEMGSAMKDAKNAHIGNKYADLTSIWDAWRAAGPKNGLAVIQIPASQTATTITLRTVLVHGGSGEWVASTLTMPVLPQATKGGGQGPINAHSVASALTYARRYSLASMVGVVADDDDGEGAVGRGHENRNGQSNGNGHNGHANGSARAASPVPPATPPPVENEIAKAAATVTSAADAIRVGRGLSQAGRQALWSATSSQRESWDKGERARMLAAFQALDRGEDVNADGVVLRQPGQDS